MEDKAYTQETARERDRAVNYQEPNCEKWMGSATGVRGPSLEEVGLTVGLHDAAGGGGGVGGGDIVTWGLEHGGGIPQEEGKQTYVTVLLNSESTRCVPANTTHIMAIVSQIWVSDQCPDIHEPNSPFPPCSPMVSGSNPHALILVPSPLKHREGKSQGTELFGTFIFRDGWYQQDCPPWACQKSCFVWS